MRASRRRRGRRRANGGSRIATAFRTEKEGYGAIRALDPKTGEKKWEFKMVGFNENNRRGRDVCVRPAGLGERNESQANEDASLRGAADEDAVPEVPESPISGWRPGSLPAKF